MKRLEVRLDFGVHEPRVVGTLAELGPRTLFEYAPSFLEDGLELSPFKVPLQPGPIEMRDGSLGSLPGVFDDSLPDGWGLRLMDLAFARYYGIRRDAITPLDRLGYLGTRAMGALTFHPVRELPPDGEEIDLERLAREAIRVLTGDARDVLPQLLREGGSPGGARPKVLVGWRESDDALIAGSDALPPDFRHFLVKFPAEDDGKDAGPIEQAYADMARAAGLTLPATRLFAPAGGGRYFGAARFDRAGPGGRERLHMHTLGGLLHESHRLPNVDYHHLLQVTRLLTQDESQVLEAFRRMVFNVLAHNRDDHPKNFAFLMARDGTWSLAPAYDLTYSHGVYGYHTLAVQGEALTPTAAHFHALAAEHGIPRRRVGPVIDSVTAAVERWPELAKATGVSAAHRREIASAQAAVLRSALTRPRVRPKAGQSTRARRREGPMR